MRRCPACGKELTRHQGEKRAEFLGRRYCDYPCSVRGRSLVAEERRIAQDRADTTPVPVAAAVEFDRKEILRVAHLAAPQIPVTLLADVVDAVEPLHSSNTRRRLMGLVAARFRGAPEPEPVLPPEPAAKLIHVSEPDPEPCPLTNSELAVVAAIADGLTSEALG